MSVYAIIEKRRAELSSLIEKTEQGDFNPLETFARLKEDAKLLDDAIKQIFPLAMSEAESYPEKSFNYQGYEFEKRNGATRYSFKGIPSVEDIEKKLKEEKERLKAAFKAHQKGVLVADYEGEVIDFPSLTYGADILTSKKSRS